MNAAYLLTIPLNDYETLKFQSKEFTKIIKQLEKCDTDEKLLSLAKKLKEDYQD